MVGMQIWLVGLKPGSCPRMNLSRAHSRILTFHAFAMEAWGCKFKARVYLIIVFENDFSFSRVKKIRKHI